MNVRQMVEEFHQTYDCPIRDRPMLPPGQIPVADLSLEELQLLDLRFDLIEEEFREYECASGMDANGRGELVVDIEAVADALGDLVYVCYGAAISLGIDLDKVIEEIHRSNMSKLGADGRPIFRQDGKVMKGPSYSPPVLRDVLFGTQDGNG